MADDERFALNGKVIPMESYGAVDAEDTAHILADDELVSAYLNTQHKCHTILTTTISICSGSIYFYYIFTAFRILEIMLCLSGFGLYLQCATLVFIV